MIDDEGRRHVDRWLDGILPVEDDVTLAQVLEDDPESLSYLAERALLHVMLREAVDRLPPIDARSERGLPSRRHVFWTTAALLASGLVATLALPRAAAGPVDLLKKALDACRPAVDRRYAVRIVPAHAQRREALGRPSPPESTLWVRDACFVHSTAVHGRSLSWGRDARGAVWFSLSPHSVAIFDADEVPDTLRDVCDLRTLDLPTLLASLLDDFDLERAGDTGTVDTIIARPRNRTARFGTVEIAIERDSLRVLRVVLERLAHGRTVAHVHFTLAETAARDATIYEWRGHVDADADVRDRSAVRGARRDLLSEFLQVMRREPDES